MKITERGPYDPRIESEGLTPTKSTIPVPDGLQGKLLYTTGSVRVLHLDTGDCFHFKGIAGMMNPCWHPDGIWFSCGQGNIYLVNTQTGQFINATPNRLHNIHARWSPDGTKLVFDRSSGFSFANDRSINGLCIMDANSLEIIRIPIDNFLATYHPTWSPDGQQIVFAGTVERYPQLYMIDTNCIDTGKCEPVQITNSPQGQCQYPRWSPDGKQIVFQTNQDNLKWAIYLMNADGSNPKRISFNPEQLADVSPCWSPDGQWIVFAREEKDMTGRRQQTRNIFIMRPDGSDITRITTDGAAQPDWWMEMTPSD